MTTEPLAPVAPAERVDTIDILRGLALFGILAANIRGFAGPAAAYLVPERFWPALHDRLGQALIDTFVQGKFLAIFAFLFGVGFAVQFERAQGRRLFGLRYAWRLLILMAFGLVHGLLIWFGDILLMYGFTGLFLLFFHKRKDKTLLVWAVLGFFLPMALMSLLFVAIQAGMPAPDMPMPSTAQIAQMASTYANGTWSEIHAQRMRDSVSYNWNYLPFIFWYILALFLFGALAWRRRLLQPAPESLPRYRRMMTWALLVGVTGSIAGTVLHWTFDIPMMPTNGIAMLTAVIQFVASPALSVGYILLVVVLCNDPVWKARLQRFGAVGRTALTNYLLQSVIGTLIFYNYGLGLLGQLGPALLLPLTIVIFAAQVWLSVWWVKRFRFGPVEWLWRSLTYGRVLPLGREAAVAAAPSEA
jgi:uncharacterized protein